MPRRRSVRRWGRFRPSFTVSQEGVVRAVVVEGEERDAPDYVLMTLPELAHFATEMVAQVLCEGDPDEAGGGL